MEINCCDQCGAEVDTKPESAQVMGITMTVHIDHRYLEAISPLANTVANTEMLFCSAECAKKYLKKFEKIEQGWLENWRKGRILGKKKYYTKGEKQW